MTKRNIHNASISLPPNWSKVVEASFKDEDACVSVGGLAHELGVLGPSTPHTPALGAMTFGKFLQYWRREHRLDVSELARQARLSEAEVLEAELGTAVPEPRVLHALSGVLNVSYDKLMRLTGLMHERDEALAQAAVRFAARSEPMQGLTAAETAALHEFVNALAL